MFGKHKDIQLLRFCSKQKNILHPQRVIAQPSRQPPNIKTLATNYILLLTKWHIKFYFHLVKYIYDSSSETFPPVTGSRLHDGSTAGTGPDLRGGRQTSKIFVQPETKCRLTGTIKDDNLPETCSATKCYRHFLSILLPHQPTKQRPPGWQSKTLLPISTTCFDKHVYDKG